MLSKPIREKPNLDKRELIYLRRVLEGDSTLRLVRQINSVASGKFAVPFPLCRLGMD